MDAKETIERDFENCWKEEWESKAKEIDIREARYGRNEETMCRDILDCFW